jgi:hypothetical protein
MIGNRRVTTAREDVTQLGRNRPRSLAGRRHDRRPSDSQSLANQRCHHSLVRWPRRQRSVYDEVRVGLSRDEALVLDALFGRHRDENQPLVASDEAEKSALIGLGAAIEIAILDDGHSEHYLERVEQARKRLAEAERAEDPAH